MALPYPTPDTPSLTMLMTLGIFVKAFLNVNRKISFNQKKKKKERAALYHTTLSLG